VTFVFLTGGTSRHPSPIMAMAIDPTSGRVRPSEPKHQTRGLVRAAVPCHRTLVLKGGCCKIGTDEKAHMVADFKHLDGGR